MQYPKARHDMADPITRGAAPADDRLVYICERAAIAFGRDPRGGGFSFVGQPAVLEHVVRELPRGKRALQRPVVIGTQDAEVIAWWVTGAAQIPFRCSFRARDLQVWVVPDQLLIRFDQIDRRAAAEIRMALHQGEIRVVS